MNNISNGLNFLFTRERHNLNLSDITWLGHGRDTAYTYELELRLLCHWHHPRWETDGMRHAIISINGTS